MKRIFLFCVAIFIARMGTYAQVTLINSNKSLHVEIPLTGNKTIVVSEIDSSIWVTDGTLLGTVQISPDIKFEFSGGLISGKLIFSGSTAATGSEIYITDGTPLGTGLVKDVYPGATGSAPDDFSFLNGFIYFSAITAAEGRELWKTNGTSVGTTLLKDIVPGSGSSNTADNYNLFSNGSFLLFAAQSASSGVELWISNGSTAGTVMLKEINTGHSNADSSNPREFYAFNSYVLFAATDATNGEEIWVTDGTAGGTKILKDINAGTANSTTFDFFPGVPYPVFQSFHTFNNHAYFNAYDGTSTGEIWSTDGTPGNTTLLKDVVSGVGISIVSVLDAVNLSSKFMFPVSDRTSRSELWESDGTPGNTKIFKSFSPINPGESPFIYVPHNYNFTSYSISQPLFQGNKFFFSAGTMAAGDELWISDGVLANTMMVKDIWSNTGSGVAFGSFAYLYTNSDFFFAADDGTHGVELWKSNGTFGGTNMVADIYLNAGDADPELTFLCNGKIIFSATNGDDPVLTDLYVVNGTFVPLPVQLTNFAVTANGNDAIVQWNTEQEINTKDFTIQRSFDAQHFDNIGNVKAAGTSSNKKIYSFKDVNIANSGNPEIYYRLLTNDLDGASLTSDIVSLKIKSKNEWGLRLLPNPVSGSINVWVSANNSNVRLSIKDVTGRTVYNHSYQNLNGPVTINANLQHGIYFLIGENNNERKIVKFAR